MFDLSLKQAQLNRQLLCTQGIHIGIHFGGPTEARLGADQFLRRRGVEHRRDASVDQFVACSERLHIPKCGPTGRLVGSQDIGLLALSGTSQQLGEGRGAEQLWFDSISIASHSHADESWLRGKC